MRRRRSAVSDTLARALGIAAVVGLAIAALLLLEPQLVAHGSSAPESAVRVEPAADPIASEMGVFRLRTQDLAAAPEASPRVGAQQRTLAIHRSLRAYPGAPPRIPHGLTADEYREARCNTCHAQGGYVSRFAAYAPVTPHPELVSCLQCHTPDAAKVGIGWPGPESRVVCSQCHVAPGVPRPTFGVVNWPAPDWPDIGQRAYPGAPQWIPHGLQMRGNCLACHGGPGAVEEIRVSHPERANCRQCHVRPVEDARPFERSRDAGGD